MVRKGFENLFDFGLSGDGKRGRELIFLLVSFKRRTVEWISVERVWACLVSRWTISVECSVTVR